MSMKKESLLQFLARNVIYAIVPGVWFAYIAGVSPWYGVAAGLTLTFLIGLPSRLVNRANRLEKSTDS